MKYFLIIFLTAFAILCIADNDDISYYDIQKESNLMLKILSKHIVKNIVIFGETGVGKSSVVNMIMGNKKAKTGDGAVGVTFESEYYDNDFLSIFDTIGLNEGSEGTVNHQKALKNLLKLCKSLHKLGGISLFIFVVKKGRITSNAPDNYELFINVFGDKNVPAILVITHAETEDKMEKWYSDNKQHFVKAGMLFNDSVTICGKTGEGESKMFQSFYRGRYESSRLELLKSMETNALLKPWKGGDGGYKEFFYRVLRFFFGNLVRHWVALEIELEKNFGFTKEDAFQFANDLASMDD